ncbi:phosphoglycerate mutase-like protein [Teratosphaeria nubilosa]|uniref:Phosphoglycerate mutase-like protein n=1 Tax=Teratosphaeria nubilosa TaxID=161662 RepID=A0A6G1LB92_9PEZI|nr:phosphoglycerate mutase-like protein [Teratosphaeria nubilosa]
MPHVNPAIYVEADSSYELEYVEVIHRHHKRTPYASNTFPREGYSWDCDDEGLFLGGKPIDPCGNLSASTYWRVDISPSNPLAPTGFNGTCQFPQITREGLDDSHQHGIDLRDVYGGILGFLPDSCDRNLVSYRVTNNVITSQVASMVIAGMYPERAGQNSPLLIQPASIDSLEPLYSCPAASTLFESYGPGPSSPDWIEHLTASADLYGRLDALSGVDPTSDDWHKSWDHYFDNLSSRLCHQKPLPCNINNPEDCVSMEEAEKVFRLGEYEYSFIYRDSPQSLGASVGSYGIWVAELAQNLRCAMGDESTSPSEPSEKVRYRHNIAHDGSISRLLSILQVDRMVWPGMGAEIVFELYRKDGCYFLRVLWGGQVMTSSNPSLARLDLVPVANILDYFDGLVGIGARKIPKLCQR